jgi:myo-inositol-1(or 4)-monophosphatase
MVDLLKIAERAASEAQEIAFHYRNDAQILSSVYKDIKTQADLEMNDRIIRVLKSTNIPIISEEIESTFDFIPSRCWIIDPLDGTYNFSRLFPCSGISISLWENNEPVLGIVKDIFTNSTFSCNLNNGSFRDGVAIKVSNVSNVNDSILATGFPSGASYFTNDLAAFVNNVQSFKKVRAIGAASIMLSYVSAGIFDAYYENDIYLWDVAAGLSLVKESGGSIYYKQKSGMKYEVLATNKLIFEEAKSLLITS